MQSNTDINDVDPFVRLQGLIHFSFECKKQEGILTLFWLAFNFTRSSIHFGENTFLFGLQKSEQGTSSKQTVEQNSSEHWKYLAKKAHVQGQYVHQQKHIF